jgi:hypothetical protein
MGPDLHQQSALELLDEPAHANETTTANEGSLSANLHRMLSRSIWKRKRWDFKARRKYFSVFWVVVVIVCSIFVGTGITVTVKVDTAKPLFVVAIDGRPPREGVRNLLCLARPDPHAAQAQISSLCLVAFANGIWRTRCSVRLPVPVSLEQACSITLLQLFDGCLISVATLSMLLCRGIVSASCVMPSFTLAGKHNP